MSRRKRGVVKSEVVLDVVCAHGHRVGSVIRTVHPDPEPGRESTRGAIRFEEAPDPDDDSGRIRGRCPKCGDDVQIRWLRVRGVLRGGEWTGRHTDEIG